MWTQVAGESVTAGRQRAWKARRAATASSKSASRIAAHNAPSVVPVFLPTPLSDPDPAAVVPEISSNKPSTESGVHVSQDTLLFEDSTLVAVPIASTQAEVMETLVQCSWRGPIVVPRFQIVGDSWLVAANGPRPQLFLHRNGSPVKGVTRYLWEAVSFWVPQAFWLWQAASLP